MVIDVLTNGDVMAFHVMDGGIITVNTDAATAMGLDYSAFNDMANTVLAVSTVVD